MPATARTETDKLPGLKEAELVKLGPCAVCGKGLFERGKATLTFYRITISRGALLLDAAQRRVGLGMMLGGIDVLARAMGPDEDLAKIFAGPSDAVVHEMCATRIGHLMELMKPEEPA